MAPPGARCAVWHASGRVFLAQYGPVKLWQSRAYFRVRVRRSAGRSRVKRRSVTWWYRVKRSLPV